MPCMHSFSPRKLEASKKGEKWRWLSIGIAGSSSHVNGYKSLGFLCRRRPCLTCLPLSQTIDGLMQAHPAAHTYDDHTPLCRSIKNPQKNAGTR
jgi:hypothetical protein